MTGTPLVEPLPSAVAEAASDLGAPRFAVGLESGAHVLGGGLAVVALATAVAPFPDLFGDDRYPPAAWITVALVAGVLAVTAVVLLRRRAPLLYCFDAGVVRTAGRSIAALPWADVPPYEWAGHLELRTAGRRFASIPAADVERVATLAAAHETVRARALIAAGTPVTYGALTLTPDSLRLGEVPAPWSAVREPLRDDDTLSLFASGRDPIRLPRRDVPHERTLLTLIREHRRA